MPKLHLNTDLFFLLKDQDIILWDYKNHQQFTLSLAYFERLVTHSRGNVEELNEIDQSLLNEGILLSEAPPVPIWQWDKLSYIFHIGTRNVVEDSHETIEDWVAQYVSDCETAVQIMPPKMLIRREGAFSSLPTPDLSYLNQHSFLDILKGRQTIRNFNGSPVSREILSTLLFVTFGLFHGPWAELSDAGLREVGMRKTSASGGGLHPNEAYVSIHNVEGVKPGIYHYDVERHALVLINDAINDDNISALCMGQPFGRGIAFGVFLVAYFGKIWWKYPHSRGYRVVLLDAGHLSQTFQLVASSLGVLTWMTANIHDVNVSSLLKLEGVHQSPLHFLGTGYGEKSGIYSGVKDYFK
ncbi:MAG: SagB/ThcOx family dehydrogenase [Alphaproteobacteria bacterium]|nr:SagB/ThcOx family dehydrogenase [Alphaproteobacteria bacterium]